MKASELIEELQEIVINTGDKDVFFSTNSGDLIGVNQARVELWGDSAFVELVERREVG